MKKMLRIFECSPYEITLESGKKIKITDEVYAGEVFEDGSFYGAVFTDCNFEGEVRFDPDYAKERLGKELFLKEAE